MSGANGFSVTPSEQPPSDIDLGALGRALWARKVLIIGPTLLVAAAALFLLGKLTPLYKSEASLLIETSDNAYTRPSTEQNQASAEADELAVTSQVQLLMSRDLAREVVRDLGLADLPEFNGGSPSLPGRVLSLLGLTRDPGKMSTEERVLDAYFRKLGVYAVARSRVVITEFSSENPDLAAKVANAVAERYLQMQQAAKQESTRQASAWLASEIDQLSRRVSEAEAKVEAFRSNSNLFLGGSNNVTLTSQQLSDLSAEMARVRSQQADARAKAQTIRDALKSGKPMESLDLANSGLIGRLAEQRVALAATIARESRTYLPAHPRMKELKAQIESLDQQINEEAGKLARAYENEADVAAARVASIEAEVTDQRKVTGSSNEQEVQLRALERDAKAQRDLLEQFLARYRDAAARERIEATPADARIISRAAASSTPYYPKPIAIVALAAVATFVLLSIAVVVAEFLRTPPVPSQSLAAPVVDTAPKTEPSRSRRALGRGIAGAIGRFRRAEPESESVPARESKAAAPQAEPAGETGDMPVFGRLQSSAATPLSPQMEVEAADLRLLGDLASHLAAMPKGEGALNILIVGANDQVDAATVALSLTRSLATADRKVVLIDAAGVDAVWGTVSSPKAGGIAELVDGDVSFGEAIQRDRASPAHIIAHGRSGPLASAAIQRIGVVFDALGLTYDFVVVLAPPPEAGSSMELAKKTDAAILVAPAAGKEATSIVHSSLLASGISDVVVLLTPEAPPRASSVLSA